MVTVKFFIFGLFETNTYVVRDEQGNALLVDPACYSEYDKQVLWTGHTTVFPIPQDLLLIHKDWKQNDGY